MTGPVPDPHTSTTASSMPARRRPLHLSGAYAGLAALCAVQAWEWGVSTIPKLTSGAFVDGFAGFVSGHLGPQLPTAYNNAMREFVVPAAPFFARLAIATELGMSLAFAAVVAALLLPRPSRTRRVLFGALGTSMVSFLFAVNLAVLNGDPPPWHVGGSPFATGVPVEYLIAGVALMSVTASAALLHRTRYLIGVSDR